MNYAADFAYEDLDNLPVNVLLEPHTDEYYTSQLLVIYSDCLHGSNKCENWEVCIFEHKKSLHSDFAFAREYLSPTKNIVQFPYLLLCSFSFVVYIYYGLGAKVPKIF